MNYNTVTKNRRAEAGNGKGSFLVLLMVVAAVAVGLWLYLGGGGIGGGSESGPAEQAEKPTEEKAEDVEPEVAEEKTEDVKPDPVERPLVIVVDGERYLHNDVEVEIKKVIELATKVPDGSGPQVRIVRRDTALARAEEALEKELTEAGIVPQIEDEKKDSQ